MREIIRFWRWSNWRKSYGWVDYTLNAQARNCGSRLVNFDILLSDLVHVRWRVIRRSNDK